MEGITGDILQLGAVAVLFLFAIKEFFSYLKAKKQPALDKEKDDKSSEVFKAIFQELQKMNSNHLHTIQGCIETGNRELVKTIHDDNIKMIEILGEIKGALSK